MKKTFATTGLFLSFFALSAFAESWSGTIVDEHCGAKHTAAAAADMTCVKKCMDGGAAAVFVAGDKVHKIENQDAIKGHEGHKVTISGKMHWGHDSRRLSKNVKRAFFRLRLAQGFPRYCNLPRASTFQTSFTTPPRTP